MKFTFPLPHLVRLKAMLQPWEEQVTGADQAGMARRAEEMGYDMLAVPEHFVIPCEHLDLSGAHYPHSTVGQAFLAGATSRIRINSGLTILPLHDPIVLAKGLATADWMSGGRITVTFGVGWLKGEFDAMGIPFHERGAMSDEYLAAMIALWTEDRPEFEGRYVSFRDVAFEPKPVQKPHVPIFMGGDSDAALRRAARHAVGWMPWLTKPEDFPARLDFIRSQPGHKGGPFELMYGLATARVGEGHKVQDNPGGRPGMGAQEIIDGLGRLKSLGVTSSAVPIPQVTGIEAYMDYAQWVIEEIKPALQ